MYGRYGAKERIIIAVCRKHDLEEMGQFPRFYPGLLKEIGQAPGVMTGCVSKEGKQ